MFKTGDTVCHRNDYSVKGCISKIYENINPDFSDTDICIDVATTTRFVGFINSKKFILSRIVLIEKCNMKGLKEWYV